MNSIIPTYRHLGESGSLFISECLSVPSGVLRQLCKVS